MHDVRSNPAMKMITKITSLALLLTWFPATAQVAKKPGEAVKMQEVKLKGNPAPGADVTAVVSFAIDQGYHTHSNKPSEPNFIATVLTVARTNGVTAGTAVYPKGKSQKVEGLDKPLSLYEEHFTISIPLKLEATAQLPLTVAASLRYQACQGAQCFPPKTLKFEIPLPASSK
jgi:hypothetical protein